MEVGDKVKWTPLHSFHGDSKMGITQVGEFQIIKMEPEVVIKDEDGKEYIVNINELYRI